MKKNFNVLVRRLIGLFGLIFLLLISPVVAQSEVTLSANVLSGVSPGVSTFVSDILQLPADGKSVVILTATILSKEGEALPNKEVVVSSNRGEVDTILCYSGSTLTNSHKTVTDSEGKARCAASSEVPGNATFTAIAEGITLDDKPTVTFTPLPFLTNLTIKVNLPGGGKLTILEPVTPKPSKPANERLVNTDVELQIPFWVVLVIILFFLTEPILIILVLRLSRKVRRGFEAEKMALAKEQELLAKVYLLESQVVQTASEIEQEVRQIESPTPPQTTAVPPPLPQSPDTGQYPPAQQL
ncbi:MAG: Ig-like domain-containing protein [Candidatus Berkelbacteria bacterium]|nr:Ig-like domain-containing protein [Candidatus Berkelbacteria bacterium]